MKVEIEKDPDIEFSFDPEPIAAAFAEELRAAITYRDWRNTGTLATSIVSDKETVAVRHGVDRLRSGELAEVFARNVMPVYPLNAARVKEAAEKSIAASVKGKKP